MEQQDSDYSFFQMSVLLDQQVRERTRQLDQTLLALQHSNAALEYEKHEVEAAQIRLNEAIDSSSDGFALFDAADCLLMANTEFALLWSASGTHQPYAKGTAFASIINTIASQSVNPSWTVRWRETHVQRYQLAGAH